jgi:hypothetical protein
MKYIVSVSRGVLTVDILLCRGAGPRGACRGYARNNQGFLLWIYELQLQGMADAAGPMDWHYIGHLAADELL